MNDNAQPLFDVYKRQRRQLRRLSQLSYNLLCAIDKGDRGTIQDDAIRQSYDALSRYMLIETNLAIDYCGDEDE